MTPEEVFLKLVHGVADRDFAALPELYAEQTDVRHPMNPYGDHPLLSRDALREHFGGTGPRVAEVVRFRPDGIRVHVTADPEVIVAEFVYAGTVLATGEPFRVPAVFVLRVRDGLIVESRDYIDHLAMIRARGQAGELVTHLTEPAAATAAS
ncbi:nuclear transport factor 2 family protein [Kribbella solani]|uniref:nuclear transport factor 2 family protein n=1 Tax=Kribbella solani TaxID=236067 RepID=UPI0029B28D6E|nr:nuclear transport factor 2 family protein [Kribbella solani]MDX2968367.1 nuclear transport factor 2 family protein [Kribbella solani]MDX3000726.1 nuclear transport factor 2 family protein [Kribbella solani]